MSLTKTELKDIQSLLTKKGRKLKKTFLAEGVRLLEEALRNQVRPSTVCYSQAVISERGTDLIRQFSFAGVRVEPISTKQLESIASTETSQGILATFPLPTTELAKLYRPAFRRLMLCENISDPGNLGTLIRSARAFAFDMVLLAGRSADPYAPKVVRATVGTIFGLPIAEVGIDEIRKLLTEHHALLLAADPNGAGHWSKEAVSTVRLRILAIGSEADGLSEDYLAMANDRLRIEHADSVESLNAAVAGSILMHELYKLEN